MLPAGASAALTWQTVSLAATVIGPPAAASPPPAGAVGGAVLVQPATTATTASAPVHSAARDVRDMVLLDRAGADGGGGSGGAGCGRRGGPRAALRPQEEGEHHGHVADPDDRLEHRGLRGEVEDPLQQGPVPGVRRDGRADVERQRVQPGQDGGLLQVVHAVPEDAGGDED